MPRRLLRFQPDGSSAWVALDAAGRPGPVREGLPPATADELWVTVPAEEVLLLTAPRVARSARQIDQALPYAIEDRLAEAVETQHVAWAPAVDPQQVRVAVLGRERMRAWLERLAAAGLAADALVPEALLLPWRAGHPSLLIEGERALLRSGETQAFCGHPDELAALGVAGAETAERIEPQRALAKMAEALRGPPPLNLLQGAFAAARRRGGERPPWRLAAMLAAATVVLAFAHGLFDRQQLAATVQAQRADMAALYRQVASEDARIVDPEQQLRAALGSGGEDQALLRLLATAAPLLAAEPALVLDALEFRGEELELVVLAPDVERLDALRRKLAAAALRVNLAAATPGTRGVEGRLIVRGGGA